MTKATTTKAGQAGKVAEELRSKMLTVLNVYNKHVNETIKVPKARNTTATDETTIDVTMTSDARDLVLNALRDPHFADKPVKPAKDADANAHKTYNELLKRSNDTKLAVRMFATAGCPSTSLPAIKIGRASKVEAPSVKVDDAEAFLKQLLGE